MKILYQKSEIWFAVVWIIAYCVLASMGDNLSASIGMQKIITLPILIILSAILFLFVWKNQLLKKFGFFDNCWFYCFDAETVKYIKEKYNGRTMGYPEEQMKNWFEGAYDFYDEIGLSMVYVKSDQMDRFHSMNLPMHHYCADTLEDVLLCIENGADLITANDPRPLMKHLGRTK